MFQFRIPFVKAYKFPFTFGRLDQPELVAVRLGQPLDEVDLLQGDLDGVLVLGSARGVRHPQLRMGERFIEYNLGSAK